MCDAFDAFSNKSTLIRDEQMHLTEHETVRTALLGKLQVNTGVDFNNFSQVEQFACDLSSKSQLFNSEFRQIFVKHIYIVFRMAFSPNENGSKSCSL